MADDRLLQIIESQFGDAAYVITSVARRGIRDQEQECDDFEDLLRRQEFKDVVIGELYEWYFLPERHEFDWNVLREIVTIITSEQVKDFLAITIVGGVIGNGAWAALRLLLDRVIREFRATKLPSARQDPFVQMRRDVETIESFFSREEAARIGEIEAGTGIIREKIYPLLKLLGFKHYRRLHACLWCRPGSPISK